MTNEKKKPNLIDTATIIQSQDGTTVNRKEPVVAPVSNYSHNPMFPLIPKMIFYWKVAK